MIKTHILPISPNYITHWGIWEAIRELIQNAYDERDANGGKCLIQYAEGVLRVSSETGHLESSSLVLGMTTKSNNSNMRGQFGEGYKLALLVLARGQRHVTIYNGQETWIPNIAYSEEYKTDLLHIEVHNSEQAGNGVTFEIEDITEDEWKDIKNKVTEIRFSELPEGDQILDDAKGEVFVGGLYVNTFDEFTFGYSLHTMKLDRDRQMLSSFDVSFATSNLWNIRLLAGGDSTAIYAMCEKELPDVKYIESHSRSSTYSYFDSAFNKKYSIETVPVSTKDEIERCQAAGRKWALVPEFVKQMLAKVRDIFVPSGKSPKERLEKLLESIKWRISKLNVQELEDIIKCLE